VHPSAPAAFCRVTVLAPDRRVDVALPVDVSLAELVPMVLELVGTPAAPAGRPAPWRFTGATGGPLPPDATLDELGVLDGEMLRLGPVAPPPPAPVFDDPVDALAALAPPARPDRRWPGYAAVGVSACAAALLATTRTAGAESLQTVTAVGLAGLGAVGALGYATWIGRRCDASATGPPDADDDQLSAPHAPREDDHDGDRFAALVAACCAVPLAAAAGWTLLPGASGATHVLLAAVAGGIAAALGQAAVRVVAPVLIAGVVVAILTSAAAAVGLRFGVAAPAVAAGTAAVAISVGPLLPRAVLRLAGLPRPAAPADARELVAADAGSDTIAAAELAERADLARGQLAGLSGGCAVVAATAALVAAPGATAPTGWSGPALAAAVVVVLLLRARGFVDPGPARAHLVAGISGGVALVGLGATAAAGGRPVGALVLLGAAALAVQALGGRAPGGQALPERTVGGEPSLLSPIARRTVDLAEYGLTALAVPLALLAAGVFTLVRGL
jgi:WXG100 protein secretion system (Wss), protein YukD/EccD-like transmembrane domain